MIKSTSTLIPFNTVSLYGMERGVVEIFDLLRPEIEPHFLMSYTTSRLDLPLLSEVRRRGFTHSFFGDRTDWPRIENPRSIGHAVKLVVTMIRGNLNVLRAAKNRDAIYIAGIQYFYFAIFAAMFAKLRRTRIIFHFHDLVGSSSRKLKFAAWFVTDFVHNTKSSYESVMRSNAFITKRRNHIIPCPIRQTAATPAAKGNLAEAFSGRSNILFMGQVSKHKGVDILLDAFDLLSRSRTNVTLHVVGGCDDPEIRQRLESANPSNQCEIRYWGYREDVLDLLKMSDVYVQPSPPSRFDESFGLGLVEAMSVGIPAVCLKSGAFTEIVVHEQTGLICDDERPETLAKSFDRLLLDRDFRDHCGRRARERYFEKFAPTRTKSLWLKLFAGEE